MIKYFEKGKRSLRQSWKWKCVERVRKCERERERETEKEK
jgi:hypothetical protein